MKRQPTIPKIILDTDPGGDDSLALLWLQSLAKQGFVEMVAVTAASGNVGAPHTFQGASRLLQLGGFDRVEVGRGVVRAFDSTIEDAAYIHGNDGMGNLSQTLPASDRAYETARSSDLILIEQLNAMPGEITVLAIAPLTNLAAAETQCPGILQQAKEIVMMGGAFQTHGNVTAEAEFNIAFDPEAAEVVFASGANLIMIPLDVTHRLIFTKEMAMQIAQTRPESAIAQFIVALCEFMTQTALAYRDTQGVAGFLVHDAATIAYLSYPETLTFQRTEVLIETQGKWTRGKTVIDRRHVPKGSANAWVATQVDSFALLASLIEDLKSLVQHINVASLNRRGLG